MSRVTAVACALALLVGGGASAYSYESAVAPGCHERFTMEALRAVRARLATAPLEVPGSQDAALIADLPYTLDPDMKDLSGATITIGARDNDLKGHGPAEVGQLAMVHGNPAGQREHCLRAIADDEPAGSAAALESCKAFIRERVSDALDGLDDSGVPDPARRTKVAVTLGLRGPVTAPLPMFWLNMGQAMHTLQDSFSHTFRSPDRMRVRSAMNWIEYVDKTEVEARDGPVHRGGMDECDGVDELRALNLTVATKASTALLFATLDPSLSRAGKLAAVEAVLDEYLGFEPGCTLDNGWCDAPERQYSIPATPAAGCSSVGPMGGAFAVFSLAFGALWFTRRRGTGAALVAALGLVAMPGVAGAQDASDRPVAAEAVAPGEPVPGVPTATEKRSERVEEAHKSLFGIYAAVSGSITSPGVSPQFGVRFRLSDRWTVGLDAELNGWYSLHNAKLTMSALNIYATGIFRTPLRFERFNLRTSASLGTSILLIDLYGAPRGSVGLFAEIIPLGLEWKASSFLYVIFDAIGIAVPIPQLSGAPFAYTQYRTALGVELAF